MKEESPEVSRLRKELSKKFSVARDAILIPRTPRSKVAVEPPTAKASAQLGRIMYIERKAGSLTGDARIGRVSFSKTGRTLYYKGLKFQSLKGAGFKSNYIELESREDYWISGPKRNGQDALYATNKRIEIDEDVREEYWREIREDPERVLERFS